MTNISTQRQSMTQIARLKTMQSSLALLQYQLASGKKTDKFTGLGTDVIASTRSRANFAEVDTYMNNIAIADRRIKLMNNAVTEVTGQAEDILNAIQIQTQQGEFEMEAVGDLAEKVRTFLTDLLNERDGDRYLFGGADAQNLPLNNTGTADSYIQGRITDWVNGTIDTDQLINSYRDKTQMTDTINGYSAALSSGNVKPVYVRVEQNTEIQYGALANDDGFRDILTAVTALQNLFGSLDKVTLDLNTDDPLTTTTAPGADKQEQNDNFYKVFNDIAAMITDGLAKVRTTNYEISQAHAQIQQISDNHAVEKATLEETIADVENADVNEVAVKLNALQVQLEASYRVTASLSQLSLAYLL